ncbi:GNAT family N-acetyltransferase [Shewanella maritima]|uniref:GNAT family N-acetyltransferase n=1 Tax=Shewanella maritima TaxID=2520507 RepID=A0A411PGC6_9GAMM|nr:GNAT family N-acetyltransferase [Shewanella maritima]QBF82637.1 GNAT family N-acetyltransferase [Shewanella maritima]
MIFLRPTKEQELKLLTSFEQEDCIKNFITPNSHIEHIDFFRNANNLYLSIIFQNKVVGFFILNQQGCSTELRRFIVTTRYQGIGIGRMAMERLHEYCTNELKAAKVWLDVFEFNEKAKYLYSQLGYRYFGQDYLNKKLLLLLEKHLV